MGPQAAICRFTSGFTFQPQMRYPVLVQISGRYRQLKMICPYESAMMDWSEERRSVCGGALYKLASATQGAKYKIIILQQTTNFLVPDK